MLHTDARSGGDTHTSYNRNISPRSDSTKWHFTITLCSEEREEVELTCLGMKGGLFFWLVHKKGQSEAARKDHSLNQ